MLAPKSPQQWFGMKLGFLCSPSLWGKPPDILLNCRRRKERRRTKTQVPRMKKYRPEDISRDRATSSWMPRAEARGVARGAKKKNVCWGWFESLIRIASERSWDGFKLFYFQFLALGFFELCFCPRFLPQWIKSPQC